MKFAILITFVIAVVLINTAEAAVATECQVAGYLREAGFPEYDVPKMVCTAKWESSFRCGVTHKNRNLSIDYGLLQINDKWWCSGSPGSKYNGCKMTCDSLLDCEENVKCAKMVYKVHGTDAWYGYKLHKAECDVYQLPASCA